MGNIRLTFFTAAGPASPGPAVSRAPVIAEHIVSSSAEIFNEKRKLSAGKRMNHPIRFPSIDSTPKNCI
jgi:hypothetical protein